MAGSRRRSTTSIHCLPCRKGCCSKSFSTGRRMLTSSRPCAAFRAPRSGSVQGQLVCTCPASCTLRTAFVHDDLPRPLQVVFKERPPEVEVPDHPSPDPGGAVGLCDPLRGGRPRAPVRSSARPPDADHAASADRYHQSSDLDVPSHHLGWLVCRHHLPRIPATYQALSQGRVPSGLPPAPQYREYIDWLQTMDVTAARATGPPASKATSTSSRRAEVRRRDNRSSANGEPRRSSYRRRCAGV